MFVSVSRLENAPFFGIYIDVETFADGGKPTLCKGRWHGVSRDGGIVLYQYLTTPQSKIEDF